VSEKCNGCKGGLYNYPRGLCPYCEISTLRARLEAAEKDAARYRWLRDELYSEELRCVMALQLNAVMDATIDAELAKEGAGV